MEPQRAVFSLAVCLFAALVFVGSEASEAGPLIDVSPSVVIPGLTSTLDINCTFAINDPPDMAAFISLVLSRANTSHEANFEEFAAITEFSPDSVTLIAPDNISATGVHSQTGESFLHITWEYPTALQSGVYQCSALGVDNIGHSVELTSRSEVTVNSVDVNDILEKLKHLEQNVQTLQNDKSSMEQEIKTLRNTTSQLESNVTGLQNMILVTDFFVLGSYENSSYHVSSFPFTNINKSINVCESLGGQLAVVNSKDELTVIQGFLKSTSGIVNLYIAGTDELTEGNWVLPDSNTQLPFTFWDLDRPYTDRRYNCLLLNAKKSWIMNDWSCHFGTIYHNTRFMCEI